MDHLDAVGELVDELDSLGLQPVLVGGMALVILGSRRVTRDFDFVIARPGSRLADLLQVFYDRDLELVSRLSKDGEIESTISNRKAASARLRLDDPASASFFSRETGLRVDLLFDYPLKAATLRREATKITVRSQTLFVASEDDLLRLKRLARARRASPGDAQDIAFLKGRRSAPAVSSSAGRRRRGRSRR